MKTDKELQQLYDDLPPNAREVLRQLCINGPAYDGDVCSKAGRDILVEKGYAARIVMGKKWVCPSDWKKPRPECEQGFQAATTFGSRIYKLGVVERRKEIVRKLVGSDQVKP